MAEEDLRHWHNNLNLKNRSQGEKTLINEYFYIISNNAFKFEVIPTKNLLSLICKYVCFHSHPK